MRQITDPDDEERKLLVEQRQPISHEAKTIPVHSYCKRCGKPYTLWFNGGELDSVVCCDFTYSIEATAYEHVIRQYDR